MRSVDCCALVSTLPRTKRAQRNCLAKALYDNIAESPDELAFRKGDILTVLEQNTNGLEGWWLCSLRGRQGIAPGNRLRLLPGMYDPTGLGYAGGVPTTAGTFPGPGGRHARRRSWTINPNKVVTPQKVGDVYLYDVPPAAKITEEYDFPPVHPVRHCHGYDIPQGAQVGSYTTPPSPRAVRSQSAYDEPRSHNPAFDLTKNNLLGYSRPRSQTASDTSSIGSAYDVPKSHLHDYDVPNVDDVGAYDIPAPPRLVETKESCLGYDIPPSHHISVCDAYDIPPPVPFQNLSPFAAPSGRSSGVSVLSTSSSSLLSPSGSQSSLNTSLSLSSLCGSNRSSLEQQAQEMYDIPPSDPCKVSDVHLQCPRTSPAKLSTTFSSSLGPVMGVELYDVPTNNSPAPFYDILPAPRPTTQPMVAEGVYDVPPQVTRDTVLQPKFGIVDESDGRKRLSSSSSDSRDSKENVPVVEGKELLLELEAAMEVLAKLQHEVQSAIMKLFSFVSTTWRKKENMQTKIYDIKTTCHRIRHSLKEFLAFAQGTLVNSTHAADRTLSHKLAKLIKPLTDSNAIVENTTQSLDEKSWHVTKLATGEESNSPDELDQLVACARGLVEDLRQVASFIQGNSTLLFKRSQLIPDGRLDSSKAPFSPKPGDLKIKPQLLDSVISPKLESPGRLGLQDRPLPPPPAILLEGGGDLPEKDPKSWINDYDYVNLESKESVEKENEEIKAALPAELHKSFENLVKQAEIPVDSDVKTVTSKSPDNTSSLDPNDHQILDFYHPQVELHLLHLNNAIDAFLLTIENNQPPKVFIGHSKFVVISAHKLVFIGDTVHRNIGSVEVKSQVMKSANNLCDSLKTLVAATKKAALQFPSVVAVQEMVDSVVDVSHLSSELKVAITSACNL